MNLAHMHLLLNHFPTIGLIVGVGFFAFAMLKKNDDLQHTSLVVLVLLALITIPAFLSGSAANELIKERPEISAALIERHQDAAIVAFACIELTGFVAWLGLWAWRQNSRPTRWNAWAVLALSVTTLALMTRAANIGGEIRHPEIQSGAAAADTAVLFGTGWLSSASILSASTHEWLWPTLETVHFIGLALLFGIVLVVNLRVMGVMKRVSLSAMHRLLPWAVLGLGANLVTGVLFFVITPGQYTLNNTPFHWKIVLVMLAAASILYQTVSDDTWGAKPGDDAPQRAKVVAMSGLLLWIAVIYCGRMLPYLGNAY